MTATCTHPDITSDPQHITLTGERTKVDLAITVTVRCHNGHTRTLYLVDIDDIDEARRLQAEWAGQHVDTCPAAGPGDPTTAAAAGGGA